SERIVLVRRQDRHELAAAVITEHVGVDALELEARLDVVVRNEPVGVQAVVVACELLPVELAGAVGAAEASGGDGDVPGVVTNAIVSPPGPGSVDVFSRW